MKKTFAAVIGVLIPLLAASFGRCESLANEGKAGLYVRSIEQVLRLPADQVDLATAALIISEHWSDLVHGRRYLAQLDGMAWDIRERLTRERLKTNYRAIPVINKYLFEELGFQSVSVANNPNDLFLHSVLDRKRGYCLSLSILYLSLGERLGLPLYGVVVPGHFFVRYDDRRVRFNIETTNNGASAPDEHYINKFKVPQANNDSIYMINLNKIQTLGCFFNNLGNTYDDIGDLEAALLALERAVQINPTLSESRSNLGNVYLKKDLVAEAIYEYQAALRINPSDAKTYNNLGNAHVKRGWLNQAVSKFRQSLALDPNFTDAYKNLAIAYCKQERFGQAVVQLQHAIRIDPKDASTYCQLGDVYHQMGSFEQAVSQYNKALKIKQDLVEAHYGLALCYHELGLIDDEIRAYKNALTIKPDMVSALTNLGNAYFAREDFDSAIELYKKALAITPQEGMIHYNLGSAYSHKKLYEQAIAAYLKAIELEPDMGDAHYGLAFGYYQLKKYELALKHIKIAKKLGVQVPTEQLEAIRAAQPRR